MPIYVLYTVCICQPLCRLNKPKQRRKIRSVFSHHSIASSKKQKNLIQVQNKNVTATKCLPIQIPFSVSQSRRTPPTTYIGNAACTQTSAEKTRPSHPLKISLLRDRLTKKKITVKEIIKDQIKHTFMLEEFCYGQKPENCS